MAPQQSLRQAADHLTPPTPALDLYPEAVERLDRTRIRSELARTHLLYGEWLRRQRRPEAREQLRTAQEMLSAMGLEAFAQRAARELRGTGEIAHKRTVETSTELTPKETQIAGWSGMGRSAQPH